MRERTERGRKLPLVKPNQKKSMGKGRKKEKKKRKEINERRKKKRKEIEERKENEEKKEEEEPCVEERRKKKKKNRHFPSRSPANRRSKLIGARGKVGLRDKGYAWGTEIRIFPRSSKR